MPTTLTYFVALDGAILDHGGFDTVVGAGHVASALKNADPGTLVTIVVADLERQQDPPGLDARALRGLVDSLERTGREHLAEHIADLYRGELEERQPVTVFDLARHRLGGLHKDITMTGADFQRAGLPMMGGCEVCHATVAAYNSCPSTSGYIRCASGCIGDDGYLTVEEADAAIFGEQAVA